MYFIPVRKIFKCLGIYKKRQTDRHDPIDISSQKYSESPVSKRWIILIFIISGIWLYVAQYRLSPKQYVYFKVPKDLLLVEKFEDIYTENSPSFNESIKNSTFNMQSSTTTTQRTFNNNDILVVDNVQTEDKKTIVFNGKANGDLPLCSYHVETNHKMNRDDSVKSQGLRDQLSAVLPGGYYHPTDCRPRHKVAILVPYRDRETNLGVFAFKMHPFLMKQKLEYRIFVIEQAGDKSFNRGCLFNVGFKEMMNYNDWHCVVFHDVDLLPLDDRILYTCPILPRHMCAAVKQKENLSYRRYHSLFGGVSSMSVNHFKKINGYSNAYWGWGGEDNDLFWRIHRAKLPIVRYNKTIARYTALPHDEQRKNRYSWRKSPDPRPGYVGVEPH